MRDPATLTANEREGLDSLRMYTAGRFDIYSLAGRTRVVIRGAIMSRLEGKHVPQTKAGVWALTQRFWTMAGVAESCNAMSEDAFIEWAKEVTSGR